MKELFIPGFEGGEKAILLPKKKNPSKEKMTFKLNFDELFHTKIFSAF